MRHSPLGSAPRGFTLTELLVVVAIMTMLGGLSGLAVSQISGAGAVSKAVGDLSGTLEMARAYAMAHHTYVRVALGQATSANATRTVVLCLYSADGSESDDATAWPQVAKPLLMSLQVADGLNASDPDTSADALPSNATFSSIQRAVADLGSVLFASFVEFNPAGEAGIAALTPSRFIKIGIDQSGARGGKNPAILRLSGINGTISVLRKEDF